MPDITVDTINALVNLGVWLRIDSPQPEKDISWRVIVDMKQHVKPQCARFTTFGETLEGTLARALEIALHIIAEPPRERDPKITEAIQHHTEQRLLDRLASEGG